MLVRVKSFGSIWWSRRKKSSSRDAAVEYLWAFYNATGLLSSRNNLRHFSKIRGHLRINGKGVGFNPHHPTKVLNCVFECTPLHVWNGKNAFTAVRRRSYLERPHRYLVVVNEVDIGFVDDLKGEWHSSDVKIVTLSQRETRQQIMLLMPPFGWVRGSQGVFTLQPSSVPEHDGKLHSVE